MKILVVPPSDYLGHPNPNRMHHIFEKFNAFGHEVFVIRFALYKDICRGTNTAIIPIDDLTLNSEPAYYLANTGIFAKSITEAMRQYKIDIVVFANLYPPYILSKLMPREFIATLDLIDHYPSIAASYVPRIVPKAAAGHVFELMMRSILRRCNATAACSYPLAEYARRNGGRNISRIPNGVEDFFFSDYEEEAKHVRRVFGIHPSDIVLCFVGNIEYWLSIDELLLAIRSVKNKTNRNIRLLLVGGKLRTGYLEGITNTVRDLNLSDEVIQVGFVAHNNVPKYIAASDICLVPKNVYDPTSYYSFPVKMWEYLALGKPVVSTPLPEVLRSAKEFVWLGNTCNDYVTAIMNYIDNPSVFVERGRAGREVARQYSWTNLARTYEQFLKATLR